MRKNCRSPGSGILNSKLALGGLLIPAIWTYLGYPALLALAARRVRDRRPHSARTDGDLPSVSVVIAALDEANVIAEKIADVRRQDYPDEKLEIVVAADGSSDETAERARSCGVKVIWRPERRGKTSAINRAMEVVSGEIVCLTDANCSLSPEALASVVAPFADANVGIVGGSKTVHGEGGRAVGEGLYWRYEAMLKESESALGMTMGAPGELLAIRTSIFRPIPEHIINDDFYLTCDALAQGYSTKYAGNAVTSETNPESIGREFSRRTRIAAGTWQTCATFSSLGSPSRGWVAIGFLSHRIMRNIVVPLTLPAIWILSRYVGRARGFGRLLLRAQNVAYLAAIGGLITDGRYLAPFTEFALINAAQICGGVRWMNGNQTTIWDKPIRDKWA